MSEKGQAKKHGLRLQKNSGRGEYSKGDASWQGFLIDIKEYSKSFGLSVAVWTKACKDAGKVTNVEPSVMTDEVEPALMVVLDNKVTLGVVAWDILEELVTFYNEHQECNNG